MGSPPPPRRLRRLCRERLGSRKKEGACEILPTKNCISLVGSRSQTARRRRAPWRRSARFLSSSALILIQFFDEECATSNNERKRVSTVCPGLLVSCVRSIWMGNLPQRLPAPAAAAGLGTNLATIHGIKIPYFVQKPRQLARETGGGY